MFAAALNMLHIAQRGNSGGLRQQIDIEGRASPIEIG
jgi:hypothetical protein